MVESTASVTSGQRAPEARVGGGFIARYVLAFASTSLVLIAPLLVTLALKVERLVGSEQAPRSLGLVVGVGAVVALLANPFFGRLSDRTTSRHGMRRPWMVIGLLGGSLGVLIVALAPSVPVVVLGWCVAQAFFNALLAVEVAVLPDQIPVSQRGLVSGLLGICLPVASVVATFVVKSLTGHMWAMFLAPCALGAVFILLFAATLPDRRLEPADKPPWSLREFLGTFYVPPRRNVDFTWAFVSRFLFVLAYAFLITFQAYFLLDEIGSDESRVPDHIFRGTVASSAVLIVASLAAGRLSDQWGRRKVFVCAAAVVYAVALFVVAAAGSLEGYLVGMAISGLGFGIYMAVDLALVADVLPDTTNVAKDLGVMNIAGALPFSVGPALAPLILIIGGDSYAFLYAVAGACALASAAAILRVKSVR
ncbi:MFS transporter [Nocardioides sp.]|uniref:MFS transporter n=1 Tax=Nocardioides sp. TaxID=35761 RepID=UPI002ED57A08